MSWGKATAVEGEVGKGNSGVIPFEAEEAGLPPMELAVDSKE